MIVTPDTLCPNCHKPFVHGELGHETWSDYLNKRVVFHAKCWSIWEGFVDFLEAGNKRSNPS